MSLWPTWKNKNQSFSMNLRISCMSNVFMSVCECVRRWPKRTKEKKSSFNVYCVDVELVFGLVNLITNRIKLILSIWFWSFIDFSESVCIKKKKVSHWNCSTIWVSELLLTRNLPIWYCCYCFLWDFDLAVPRRGENKSSNNNNIENWIYQTLLIIIKVHVRYVFAHCFLLR